MLGRDRCELLSPTGGSCKKSPHRIGNGGGAKGRQEGRGVLQKENNAEFYLSVAEPNRWQLEEVSAQDELDAAEGKVSAAAVLLGSANDLSIQGEGR